MSIFTAHIISLFIHYSVDVDRVRTMHCALFSGWQCDDQPDEVPALRELNSGDRKQQIVNQRI